MLRTYASRNCRKTSLLTKNYIQITCNINEA